MENSKKLPFFYVGKATTDSRKENFIRSKYPLLCEGLGKQDTQSIWYSRNHILALLEEIEHAGGDGLRLHFGAYEEGHEFEGQLCLVMNVTRYSNEKRVDVIVENEADFDDRSKATRSTDGTDHQIPRDFNFGSPCPPRCDGD